MNTEPSPRPWHTANFINGIEDANDGKVAANIRDADAKLIVAAVNERAKFEEARMEFPDFRPVIIAAGQRDAAIAERDRLRAELADKTRNYEDVIAFHTRTEEALRDIVRRAIPFVEGIVNAGALVKADDPDVVPFMTKEQKAAARKAHEEAVPLLAEARKAIGEDKK